MRSWTLVVLFVVGVARAQGPAAAPQKACVVQHMVQNDANDALAGRKFAEAGELFAKQLAANPQSTAAQVGLVRSRLGQGRVAEAFELATKFVTATPDEPMIETVYGEVRLRRGEVGEAAAAFNKAARADFCLGRVHYDIARFQTLSGNYLTAQKQIELAHKLAPDDAEISGFWTRANAPRHSAEELLTRLRKVVTDSSLTPEKKAEHEKVIRQLEGQTDGACTMEAGVEATKIPLLPISGEDGAMSAIGMDVEMNGKKRRVEVDTGASGLTVTRAFADSAGLTQGDEERVGGACDEGATRASATRVETLRIGGMEFHNCAVTVLQKTRELPIDGLIGADVFGRWVVTLDIPMRQMRLAPLPKRPEEGPVAPKVALYTHGAQGRNSGSGEPGGPYDRYIAPEMQDWTKVYRSDHLLIFPTRVNALPARLFILDTGAFSGSLTTQVGREVGNLAEVDTIVRGLSGEAAHVYTVDKQVVMDFGGVRQALRGITVMDNGSLTRSVRVEISGFIGFKTLQELAISIDYRDNLVKVVFDPKHGFHSNGNMEF